jgi:hypothetical protein
MEAHVLEADLVREPIERPGTRGVHHLDRRVEELEDALGRDNAGIDNGREFRQPLRGLIELHAERKERNEAGTGQIGIRCVHHPRSVPEQDDGSERSEELRHRVGERAHPLGADVRLHVAMRETVEPVRLELLRGRGLHLSHTEDTLLQVRCDVARQRHHATVAALQAFEQAAEHAEHQRQDDQRNERQPHARIQQRVDGNHDLQRCGEQLEEIVRNEQAHLVDIGGEASDDVAGARAVEESQVELEQVLIDLVPRGPDDGLLELDDQDALQIIEHVLQQEHREDENRHTGEAHLERHALGDEAADGMLEQCAQVARQIAER